jgi:mannose-6-phosphate isomerase
VLAVERPLSLQVHPDAAQARVGFAAEEARGLARDDPARSYPDDRAKPELLCALGPFEALCGLREAHAIHALAERLGAPELAPEAEGEPALRAALGRWLAPRSGRSERLEGLAEAARRRTGEERAFAWVARLAEAYPGDPGLLAPLFLHAVALAPEEALFVAPGTLHAHLAGLAVEVQASTDSVLRAGLTEKHVHVEEVLRVVRCEPVRPAVVEPRPRPSGERVYEVPCDAFELALLEPPRARPLLVTPAGVEILLCREGAVRVAATRDGVGVELARGQSCLVPAAAGPYRVEGAGVLFRASLPR